MKKRWKIVLAVLALLAAAVLFGLPFLLDAGLLKGRAEASLSEMLGRQVSLGDLSLQTGWGIRARTDSLEIGEPLTPRDGEAAVIRAEAVRLKVALLPLLRGEVDVRKLAFRDGAVVQDGVQLLSGLELDGRLKRLPGGELTFDGRLSGTAGFLSAAPLDAVFRTRLNGDRLEVASLEADLGPGRVTGTGAWTGIETGDLAGVMDLAAVCGRTEVAGDVTVELPGSGTKIRFDFTSPLVDFDELAVLTGFTGRPAAAARTAPSLFPVAVAAEKKRPAGPPLKASGTLAADRGLFAGLEMTGLSSRVELDHRGLRLEDAQFGLYGGEHRGSFQVNTGSPDLPFHLASRMTRVDLDGLLQAFSPETAGSVLGTVALVLDLDGRVGDDRPEGTVTGSARLDVTEGVLTSDSLVAGIGRGLQAAGITPPDGDVTPFERLSADFRVRERLAFTDNLELRSPHLDLDGRGTLGLDGSLDFSLDARLSAEITAALVEKAGSIGSLVGGSGRLRIPIGISGTLEDPRVGVDLDGLVKDRAKERLKDRLKGLFGK